MRTTFLLLLCFYSIAWAQEASIIVNEANTVEELTSSQISEYFMKKRKTWPDGNQVRFFDRTDDSPERKFFMEKILHKKPREMELYWIGQKLYTGHSAPTQVSSDSITLTLVSRFPGAIGIISTDALLTKGVKKVKIVND